MEKGKEHLPNCFASRVSKKYLIENLQNKNSNARANMHKNLNLSSKKNSEEKLKGKSQHFNDDFFSLDHVSHVS